MVAVVITQNDDISQAIDAALGRLQLEPLVRGRLVAVKPNETCMKVPLSGVPPTGKSCWKRANIPTWSGA